MQEDENNENLSGLEFERTTRGPEYERTRI